ncbi:motility associated factor glycosyltransferase family protein [Brevibacillus borstelensis]|uniref:motility associated factor glycosyltransferase family protein n=1 Tax=Brevibacillus borstelensis TaxID=45462 RepID=UPI002E20CF02|nr:DUF115 domain-containing protein [Brevibacillus borstelensis]
MGPHIIQIHDQAGHAPTVALEKAKNGMWTASVKAEDGTTAYLHSRYDPHSEAVRWASAQQRGIDSVPDRIIVYGIGCGHHIEALLDQTAETATQIEVWETNVSAFSLLEENHVLDELSQHPRLTLVVSDEIGIFSLRMEGWKGLDVHVFVHEPSLRAVPYELTEFKRLLQFYQVRKNSVILSSDVLDANFAENTRKLWPSLARIKGRLAVPAILVSAGPSLAKNISLLSKASAHGLIGAVGTVAKTLIANGIRPDFVVMSDPYQNMLKQLEGWGKEGIPLFFLSTLYPGVVQQYEGPKVILYQNGYEPAEQQAAKRGEPLVETGGSVSTTMFSLARVMGCGPICLVGQDLAHTDGRTHIEGTLLFKQLAQQGTETPVRSFDGNGTVRAPRNLLLYKQWFEKQAQASSETFYNATEGGAYIEGFEHVTLAQFLEKVGSIDATPAREELRRFVATL